MPNLILAFLRPLSLKRSFLFSSQVTGQIRLARRVVCRTAAVFLGCLVLLTGCLAPAATSATSSTAVPSTTSATDSRLVGLWTTEAEAVRISLNEKGEPVDAIPVGQWYSFDAAGQYFWVARHMTFAIGGVMVEEGRYGPARDGLRLYGRTESFFPDKGSPQKAKYREPLPETALVCRIAEEDGTEVLFIKSASDQPEIRYIRCSESK